MNFGVIGCGNMAQAIIVGMSKKFTHIKFHTYTPSHTRAEQLAKKVNGQSWKNLDELPKCDYYLIACKPQQVLELASSFKESIFKDTTLISILAGTTVESLSNAFEMEKVVRVMPNTPALVNEGVHTIYFKDGIEEKIKEDVKSFFNSVGTTFIFESEEMIDKTTAFSGSGPAYLFEIARIMTEELILMGLSREDSTLMIKKMLYGSAKLLYQSDEEAETLRNNVTSKKGVTYEALEVFKENNMALMFNKALDAAYKRSQELAKGQ